MATFYLTHQRAKNQEEEINQSPFGAKQKQKQKNNTKTKILPPSLPGSSSLSAKNKRLVPEKYMAGI